jgi:virulence factor Mce-like protein
MRRPTKTPGARRARDTRLRTGIIVAMLLAFFLYFCVTKTLPFIPSSSGRVITADFTEPNQLTEATPVRVDGVNVGHVKSVSLAADGRGGIVRMQITNKSVHLHTDATAAIKFRTLLGANMEIDLTPGSPSAPSLDGAAIPIGHTTVQTEFDDVLQTFSHNTPAALRVDLEQLAAGFRGEAAGKVVDTLAPSLSDVPAGLSALQGHRPDDLQTLIRTSASTVQAIGADRAKLEGLVTGGQQTFQTTADASTQLGETLQRAPAAMDATVRVAHTIERTLPALNTLSTALLPGVRSLAPAIKVTRPAVVELDRTLRTAQPLVQNLRPAVDELAAAAVPGTAVLTGLDPTVDRLNSSLIPWLQHDDSDLHIPVYDLIGPTVATLAAAAGDYDNFGHFLHFPIAPAATSLGLIPCTVFVADPTASQLLRCDSLNQLLSQLMAGTS